MKKFLLLLFLIVFSKITLANVFINEIMYNPQGNDSGHEWLEIYSSEYVNISGWVFYEDGTNHGLALINGSWIIRYAVIVDEYDTFLSDYPDFNGTLIDSSWSSLSNSGEYIAVKNRNLEFIDGINYSTEIANGNGKSLSLINESWVEADPTPGYENIIIKEEEKEENKNKQDIKLEVYLEDEINIGIEQTKLFKITNLNPELGKAYNINVYYNITKDDLLIKEDIFVKDEVNYYSTTDTGFFFPERTGEYYICGRIINSSINDTNSTNDYACKYFTVVDTSLMPCNITLNITTDKEIYIEGESVKFNHNLNNEEFPFVIEYWIEDFFDNIYKEKYNTTNTNQKSWKTDIEEQDRVLFIKSIVYPNCNDSNLLDNSAEKMFIVKSEYNESEDIVEKDEESSLEIVEVDDNVKFGDTLDVKVKIYKGNTNKYSISLWVEDGKKKISEVTKIHLYEKYSSYNGQLPIKLDNNCDLDLDDGEYDVVIEGLDKEDRKEIGIEGITTSLCPKTSSTKKISSSKKFEYEVIDAPYFVNVGEEFISRLNIVNNDEEDYDIAIWSYVYRGSKCYSGDKEQNKEKFVLQAGEARIIELKNVVLDAESGPYNLKLKINKNNQKTDYEITKQITIEALPKIETTKTIEKKENITKKLSFQQSFRPQIIYESTTYKSKKLILYFIIAILTFLSVILIWRR